MTLPIDFITRTRELLGQDYDALEKALEVEPPVSIRMNPYKQVSGVPVSDDPVPWCATGYYLPVRPSFTFDPLFHAGAYYVQEASSMFLEQVVRSYVKEPVVCLDLCAAPGGKSTHLRTLLPEGSVLVSNEVVRTRANILAENMAKWGHPDVIVTNADPAELGQFTHLFDVILTDVPCSGEGMFRKDPASREEWSAANVRLCADRQRKILADIWNALKPGGILIYSTCTFNTEEDEENVQAIIEQLGAEPLEVPVDPEWNISPALKLANPVYRFFPGRTRGEGFFLAALRKSEDGEGEVFRKLKDKKMKGKTVPAFPRDVESYLRDTSRFRPYWTGAENTILRMQSDEVARLVSLFRQQSVRMLSAGIEIGELKGKDLVPAQALALSVELNRNRFPEVEVTQEEAVRYLRKEALVLPSDTPRGFVLLIYRNLPLGFVKNLGNRSNNLYPQEWKIRSFL